LIIETVRKVEMSEIIGKKSQLHLVWWAILVLVEAIGLAGIWAIRTIPRVCPLVYPDTCGVNPRLAPVVVATCILISLFLAAAILRLTRLHWFDRFGATLAIVVIAVVSVISWSHALEVGGWATS
jgi:hypothetical protein